MSFSMPACLPLFMTFICGIGSSIFLALDIFWICSYNFLSEQRAPALQAAIETPRIAFAPSLDLFSVPSSSIKALSISLCFLQSKPIIFFDIILLTLFAAFRTPLPRYLFLLPSLNSNASCTPVDAPLGTIALAQQESVFKPTSIVGLPLESRTSFAFIFFILWFKKITFYNEEPNFL